MKPSMVTVIIVAITTATFPALSGTQHRLQAGLSIVKHPGLRQVSGANPVEPLGNVWMITPNGLKVLLTSNGLASDPQVAPNGRFVGWIEEVHADYPDRDAPYKLNTPYPLMKTCFPSAVVIHRPGKPNLHIVPEKLFSVTWKFDRNGTAVGIGSAGSHGPYYLQLFDAATGKQIASCMGFEDQLPSWTEGLGNR